MKSRGMIHIGMFVLLLALAGCGGGGSSSAEAPGTVPTSTDNIASRQISVKLSTSGNISSNAIKGLQFEIVLPAGVSVKSDADGLLADYVLTSGVALTASNLYISGGASGSTVSIIFANGNGISTGEFATLTCDVALNTTMPTADSFTISSGYKVIDIDSSRGSVPISDVITIRVSSVTAK